MPTPQDVATQLRQLAGEIEGATSQAALEIIRDSFGLTAQLTALWKPDQPPDSTAQVFTIQQTTMRKEPTDNSGILRYIPVFTVMELRDTTGPSGKWILCGYEHPTYGRTVGWVNGEDTEPFHPCQMDLEAADLAFMTDFNRRIYIPRQNQDTPALKQYISLEALGMGKKTHYNLCGPFCIAALTGLDVIPLLKAYLYQYPAFTDEIRDDNPLGLFHMRQMLHAAEEHLKTPQIELSEITFSPSSNPLSARMLRGFCQNGKMIAGVGIDRSGIIRGDGSEKDKSLIRHWVVILDVLPCGTGGFVRVYNPFQNREETVGFITLWYSMFPGGSAAKVLLVKGV